MLAENLCKLFNKGVIFQSVLLCWNTTNGVVFSENPFFKANIEVILFKFRYIGKFEKLASFQESFSSKISNLFVVYN